MYVRKVCRRQRQRSGSYDTGLLRANSAELAWGILGRAVYLPGKLCRIERKKSSEWRRRKRRAKRSRGSPVHFSWLSAASLSCLFFPIRECSFLFSFYHPRSVVKSNKSRGESGSFRRAIFGRGARVEDSGL